MKFSLSSAPSAGTSSRNSYADVLAEGWAAHLAKRVASAPTVISTFAGAGGSSLGYSMAGYRERLAVELDDNAVATFRLNFRATPVYHGDIMQLSSAECLQRADLKVGELDVLDGSPPCQGFSTAGKRALDDPRNQLFREYVRLLRGLQPKAFVMENVGGMVKGKMKLIFADIMRELRASGYRVSARLMNAMFFHVPQARERLIFVGVRDDLKADPSHPRPAGRPFSAGTALWGANNDPAQLSWLLNYIKEHAKFNDYWQRLKPGDTLADVGGIGNNRHAGFSYRKYRSDRPAYTIMKSDGAGGPSKAMHWSERRGFTVAEFKRFASFPDEFRFAGEWGDAVQRIGNSVPPLFMRAIAEHLRHEVLGAM